MCKKNTFKFGYNGQLGTGHFCSLYTGFFMTDYLCSRMTNLPLKSVRYNKVLFNNRVVYNQDSLYLKAEFQEGQPN